jgi:type IV pilus assembly protein PilB
MIRKNIRLGELLIQIGKITKEQLNEAIEAQSVSGKRLGEVLIDLEYIKGKEMNDVLEYQLGIPHIDLERHYIEPEIPHFIEESFARENILIPVKVTDNELMVAMNDPFNIVAINDMQKMTELTVKPVISTKQDILNAIAKHYDAGETFVDYNAVEDFKREFEVNDEAIDKNLLNEINNAPIVRLVNSIILQAIQQKASDIHIEPGDEILRIRYRIDGDLREVMKPAKQTHGAIVARIKIMASMDIAERRVPQDGRIEFKLDKQEYDLRISSTPTIYGEKIVIRILDRTNFLKDKTDLGFSEINMKLFDKLIKSNNGIILLTGPTGSGKSTTLYTILSEINDMKRNILTIEDPVEYKVAGINQMQVNSKAGLTFATGLRSMLRQDPDIIMVGEIRDSETAEIAIRAAITGHLVLSTLHTNSAPATIDRLIDMDIAPYLVASSITGIIAQRLVKVICPMCKEAYKPDETELKILGLPKDTDAELYRGKGCSYCSETGYRGRTAIHEIMLMDRTLRNMVIHASGADEIKDYALSAGMTTLRANALELVLNGTTTLNEYTKVAYSIGG